MGFGKPQLLQTGEGGQGVYYPFTVSSSTKNTTIKTTKNSLVSSRERQTAIDEWPVQENDVETTKWHGPHPQWKEEEEEEEEEVEEEVELEEEEE